MSNDKKKFLPKINEFLDRLKKGNVSILEEKRFIENLAGSDPEDLRLLKLDIEFAISDEKWTVEEKNAEIKRNTNDEYYLSGLRDEPAEGLFRARVLGLERLKRRVEYKIQQSSEGEAKGDDPWERLDGLATKGIKNFLKAKQFSEKREKAAKTFLTTFEIMAKETSAESLAKNFKQTAEDIQSHETFDINPEILPGLKTLRSDWLAKYYKEYRFFG